MCRHVCNLSASGSSCSWNAAKQNDCPSQLLCKVMLLSNPRVQECLQWFEALNICPGTLSVQKYCTVISKVRCDSIFQNVRVWVEQIYIPVTSDTVIILISFVIILTSLWSYKHHLSSWTIHTKGEVPNPISILPKSPFVSSFFKSFLVWIPRDLLYHVNENL